MRSTSTALRLISDRTLLGKHLSSSPRPFRIPAIAVKPREAAILTLTN